MEQKNGKNEADTTAVDLEKPESSEKKSPNLSKSKSDIAKSMAKNFMKTRKANVASEVQRKKKKKKIMSVSEGSKATENDVIKTNLMEENQQKDASTSMEQAEKGQQIIKNKENTSASDSKEKIMKSNGDSKKRRSGEEPGLSNKNKKDEGEQEGNKRRKGNERKEQYSNSVKNNSNDEKRVLPTKEQTSNSVKNSSNDKKRVLPTKEQTSNSVKNNTKDEKRNDNGKKQESQKKEKIDGLIFMCNAKTKPDCFRYHVLGVSAGKKDLVLNIRPGLKLFLYDYDLRLMYGIYKASSNGGMKLEPKAFGGAFPAQVRFSVYADCFPLAENIFKKAIKENYDEKNKFKFELTARQVRKLTELFRPVPIHSTAPPFLSPSRAATQIIEHPEKREVHDRRMEAKPPTLRGYAGLPHERDQRAAYGESASTRREDGHRDFYLSEKDYRAYGLLGERRNLTPQRHITPALTSYLGDHRERPLRQPDIVGSDPLYRSYDLGATREGLRSYDLGATREGLRSYDLGATREGQPIVSVATANTSLAGASILNPYIADPFYGHYSGDPLVDAYLPRPGAAHLFETDHLRRENRPERLYSTFRSDALANRNQIHRHQHLNPASAPTSVSSRYSFGGASLSYR